MEGDCILQNHLGEDPSQSKGGLVRSLETSPLHCHDELGQEKLSTVDTVHGAIGAREREGECGLSPVIIEYRIPISVVFVASLRLSFWRDGLDSRARWHLGETELPCWDVIPPNSEPFFLLKKDNTVQ